MSAYIIRIKADWLRVPLWSLWFPLTLPHFVFCGLRAGAWRRLLQAECWSNVFAMYLIGLDGWGDA